MPVIAGISYELIRFAGAHADNILVRIAITPGLLLQKLTTRQPDDSQIEVAIASLKAVLPPEDLETYFPADQENEVMGEEDAGQITSA